ncbi:MAG: hypothetical protein V5A74_04025 [Desulfohalobiaceae bacterium]
MREVTILNSLRQTDRSVPQKAGQADFSGLIHSTSVDKDFYLTPPYYSSPRKELVVSMIWPLFQDRMILAELDLDTLRAFVSDVTGSMQSGFAIVTDSNGKIIAHPDMTRVDQRVRERDLQPLSSSGD